MLSNAFAEDDKKQEVKAKMTVVAKFEGGQPQVSIYKLYDPSEDVICYALMPEVVLRKKVENGWAYDGNTVGSISCLKNKQVVVPIQLKPQ